MTGASSAWRGFVSIRCIVSGSSPDCDRHCCHSRKDRANFCHCLSYICEGRIDVIIYCRNLKSFPIDFMLQGREELEVMSRKVAHEVNEYRNSSLSRSLSLFFVRGLDGDFDAGTFCKDFVEKFHRKDFHIYT